MTRFVPTASIDGKISALDEAAVPITDRGFLYGDSVYEVFRTYDGVPLLYDEHWQRLQNSADLIGLRLGDTKSLLTGEIKAAVAASGAAELGQDVYVRYIVTRGSGPIDLKPSSAAANRRVVIVNEIPAWNPVHYEKGIELAIVSTQRNPSESLDPNIKGGNYLNNVLGLAEAEKLGADDCLMLNDSGLVTEASNSNVFFVLDGRLVTPSQKAANLRGLTKATIHAVCAANGLTTEEVEIPADAALTATECFISSATREVMPVVSLIDGRGEHRDFPVGGGPVTRRVAELYKGAVAEYVASHRALSLF